MKGRSAIFLSLFLIMAGPGFSEPPAVTDRDSEVVAALHEISSESIMAVVRELCDERYGGRLTGTQGYAKAADWIREQLLALGVEPAGESSGYFQFFANPYTQVLDAGSLVLHHGLENGEFLEKPYRYELDYLPGSTSASGELYAPVVYVGYGITAPELGFDEYEGLDVHGKIVLVEREVPLSAAEDPKRFRKWRPYSFHQYKVKNARDHGAVGMLYNYHIANPNCLYLDNFLLSYVSRAVVNDLFLGSGYKHGERVTAIAETLRPHSLALPAMISMSNLTRHYPEGTGINVIGRLAGPAGPSNSKAVVLGAHLDHVGLNHRLMPGANDNASGVAVLLAVTEALVRIQKRIQVPIWVVFFGAEEQGVRGSKYFLKSGLLDPKRIKVFLNLDGVGRGREITVLGGKNHPQLFSSLESANNAFVHRQLIATDFHNLTRPRLDAARFATAGIPSLSFSCGGAEPLPFDIYHKTGDTPEILTPEIMEDLARILFLAVLDLSGKE